MSEAGNIYLLPDLKKSEAEAAEWVARLEGGEMTAADHAAFARWRAESEHHRDAFDRYARLWGGLDALEELKDYEPQEAYAAPRRARRPAALLPALAATLVLAVAIGVFTVRQAFDGRAEGFAAVYHTEIGGQETIELPDGSRLTLNTDSLIETDFTETERRIMLLRGEAFFEVASDKSRPFSVYAGDGVVRAVGTAFSVRLKDDKLDVMVSEGRVALSAAALAASVQTDDAGESAVMELTAGQNAVFAAEKVEELEHVTQAEIDRKLSWRRGMLAFAGEPLSEVVVEIGRYSGVVIDISSDELLDMPIAGYFKAGEVDAFVEALQIMTGVEVTEIAPGHLALSVSKAG